MKQQLRLSPKRFAIYRNWKSTQSSESLKFGYVHFLFSHRGIVLTPARFVVAVVHVLSKSNYPRNYRNSSIQVIIYSMLFIVFCVCPWVFLFFKFSRKLLKSNSIVHICSGCAHMWSSEISLTFIYFWHLLRFMLMLITFSLFAVWTIRKIDPGVVQIEDWDQGFVVYIRLHCLHYPINRNSIW